MPVELAGLASTTNENVIAEGRPLGISNDGFSLIDGTNSISVQRAYIPKVPTSNYAAAASALGRIEKNLDSRKVRVFGKIESEVLGLQQVKF